MKIWKAVSRSAPLLCAIFLCACSKQPAAPQAIAPPEMAPAAPSPPEAAPDNSTPKGVSLAFASAIAGGDSAAMRSLAVGTDGHLFAVDAGLADLVQAQHLFTETLRAKFGDACTLPPEIEHIGNLPPMPANYDQLTEKIDGDTAVLVDESGHQGVKLKKVDGHWKVDIAAADAALPPDAQANLVARQKELEALKKAFNQATAKIIDGTYTDCQAALNDVMSAIKTPLDSGK